MPYQSEVIANIINRLNIQYFLPAIQREFVWHQEQIIRLFDSVMRGYPVSSFLFWELKPENRENWDIYRFVDNFKEEGTRNEPAHVDGVQQLILVLDGQQRFTSLLIGLKGSYTMKKKYMRRNSTNAWSIQRLYLDLLKNPKTPDIDAEEGIHYGFQFFADTPLNTKDHYWLKVGRILDFSNENKFREFKYNERENLPGDVTKNQIAVFEQNLDRLYWAIWKDAVISYYIETDQDYDRVLDIFVRANEGGTPLSKSDLLLSMATSKWKNLNARDEIYSFVDRLNNELPRKNKLNKDFIMKACLVLSDLPIPYKVSTFNNQNLELIEKNWVDIKEAIETGVQLVNIFGIDRDTLTSANALTPILYYLYKHPGKAPMELTPSDVRNAQLIRTWLTSALLNNAFGGQSDQALTETRRILRDNENHGDFPVDALNAEISKMHRNTNFDEATIDNFLEISYGKQQTFLALSLLYDDNNWGTLHFQQDHIFPKSLFSEKRMNEEGIKPYLQDRYINSMNSIGNLQLLLPIEHKDQLAKDFDEWIVTRDESFKVRHLIPLDESLYRFDRFDKFIEAREALIRERLKSLFIRIQEKGGD